MSQIGELGDLLRRSREQSGITLAGIEAATHIKRTYLEALEAENFDVLPNQVAAYGFLRDYASTLKLDATHVPELYEQSQEHSPANRPSLSEDKIQFKSISMMPPPRFSPDLFIGFLVIIALVGAILYFVDRRYLSSPGMALGTGLASYG